MITALFGFLFGLACLALFIFVAFIGLAVLIEFLPLVLFIMLLIWIF